MHGIKIFSFAIIFFVLTSFSHAQAVTNNNSAIEYQQVCGKSIMIKIKDIEEDEKTYTLLELQNKSTMKMDFFLSEKSTTALRNYEKYNKVYFDSLSQRYLPAKEILYIVWGAARQDGNAVETYSLALGSHVYSCGKLEILPDETPDLLYGEQENSKQ